jgi:hypothetical protein
MAVTFPRITCVAAPTLMVDGEEVALLKFESPRY